MGLSKRPWTDKKISKELSIGTLFCDTSNRRRNEFSEKLYTWIYSPLAKEIATLSQAEKSDFKVIDRENLSFLALDEIYNIHDLIGL